MSDEENRKMANLADLRPGQTAYVQAMAGRGSLRKRLMDMGIVPGTEVTMLRRAPLGDPLELMVKGYYLSLRASEAELVKVSDTKPERRDGTVTFAIKTADKIEGEVR